MAITTVVLPFNCDTTAEEVSRFQRLFPNPSWLVWGRASRHQKFAPTFPWIDNCLMVTKRDFLEMEASLWLNEKSWVSLKVGCLTYAQYAVGKQLSIPLINLGKKWTLSWWWWWLMNVGTKFVQFAFFIAHRWIESDDVSLEIRACKIFQRTRRTAERGRSLRRWGPTWRARLLSLRRINLLPANLPRIAWKAPTNSTSEISSRIWSLIWGWVVLNIRHIGVFRGPLCHCPPLAKKISFGHRKK